MIGRGSDAEITILRNQAVQAGVRPQVHLAGFRFPVEPVLAGLDVLMAPSETEGFGRALVESMLVGTPVIASDIAAHREILDSPGLGRIAAAGDARAFAQGIADMTASPHGLAAIGAAGQASAQARFSCRKHTARMRQIYERLLRSASA
jgi:glycosyltransferase involved in cell wall biosynthesis